MALTTDEMPLRAALDKAKDYWPDCPMRAVRDAVRDGVIPSTRSSHKSRARYYVRWPVLLEYLKTLRA